MIDIDRQIRDYYESIVVDVEIDDIAVPSPATVPRVRRATGWAVAAVAAILMLLLIGGVAWLLRTPDGPAAPADEPQPTVEVPGVPTTSSTPAVSQPVSDACAQTIDPEEAVEAPISAIDLPRTRCALTDVLNAYIGAWAGHDAEAIASYFRDGIVIIVDEKPAFVATDALEVPPFVAPGTYEDQAAVEILETWFDAGLSINRPFDGGGRNFTHNETLFFMFDDGSAYSTSNALEFTGDPFQAASDDERPLLTHTIRFYPSPRLSTKAIP